MAESSVDSYINAQPEQAMSMDEYWQQYKQPFYQGKATNAPAHYNDLNYRIAKFFGHGAESSFDSAYEAYINNLNQRNETTATQSARAYDRMMDDTKYQRMMKDFEAAGLNPYLLVNNGGVSAGSIGSSAKADYGYKRSSKEKSSTGRDAAIMLLAIARLAAALL